MAFCRQCGTRLRTDAKFCASCGTASSRPPSAPVSPRPSLAAPTSATPGANDGLRHWLLLHRSLLLAVAGVVLLLVLTAAGTHFLRPHPQPYSSSAVSPSVASPPPADATASAQETSEFTNDEENEPPQGIKTDEPKMESAISTTGWEGEHSPETRTRFLSLADIDGWSYDKVRYAVNEIYTRHGYPFKSGPIRKQFAQFRWYRPVEGRNQPKVERFLSATERANMKLLSERRSEMQKLGAR